MGAKWDARDAELKLRERFAQLIAEKTSGVEGAEPTQDDFDLADSFAEQYEWELEK